MVVRVGMIADLVSRRKNFINNFLGKMLLFKASYGISLFNYFLKIHNLKQ